MKNILEAVTKFRHSVLCAALMCLLTTSFAQSVIISKCDEGTVNLSNHVSSSPPSGTSVTFHSGTPATNANKLNSTQYQDAAPGLYYAAYFDQTNDCYSPTSEPMYVIKCISNECPSGVVNLTTKFGFPSVPSSVVKKYYKLNTGANYSQDANPESIGTVVSNATSVSAEGKYFAVLYDPNNNCYSPLSHPIDVGIEGCILAKDDISQTPINVPVSGNVLLNDDNIGGGDLDVQIMQGYDSNGNLVTISTDSNSPTTIYAPDPNNPGSYINAGTLSINLETGDFTYIPANNYTGVVPVVYTAVNESGQTDNANLTITIIPESTQLNNPPVANDDTNIVVQGESVTTVILANDSDPDGDNVTVQYVKGYNSNGQLVNISTNPSSPTTVYVEDLENSGTYIVAGTAALDSNGELIFNADENYEGLVPFEYSITDGKGGTDTANVTIRVLADDSNSSDNSTVANDDANVGFPEQLMTGNILDNDTDKENNSTTVTDARLGGTPLSIGQVTTLADGSTLKINSDGTYEYVAGPGVVETKVVTYTKCDNGSPQACDQATLLLTTIRRPNTTDAENDINQTPENISLKGNILTNDSDKEGDSQTIVSILADTNGNGLNDNALTVGTTTTIYGTDETGSTVIAGTIKINADGSYDYVPATNFRGNLDLVYGIEDDNSNKATDTAILSIEVNGENQGDSKYPPIAQDDIVKTEKDQNVIIPILSNDSDVDGNLVTSSVTLDPSSVPGSVCNVSNSNGCTKVTVPNEGTYTVNPDGTVTFDPVPTFVGTTTPLEYRVCDNDSKCDEANITVEISDPTRNEMSSDDDANIGFNDENLVGNVIDNDIDPDGSTGTPSISSAKVDSDGDGSIDDNLTVGTATTIYGTDPSNSSQNIVAGELTLNSDGSYTFEPNSNFTGTVNVPYTVCDNDSRNACSTSTLHLTVIERNATIAEDDVNQTPMNTKLFGDVSTNDRDEEGDDQSVTAMKADTDGDGNVDDVVTVGSVATVYGDNESGVRVIAGILKLNSDGTYEYTPANNFKGEVPFNYTVTDEKGATDPADVIIRVLGEDNNSKYPPVANDDHVKTDPDVTVVIPIVANDSDVDGNLDLTSVSLNPQSVPGASCVINSVSGCIMVSVPNEGSYIVNPNGTVSFDPSPDFTGTTTPLEYEICDNDSKCDKANITVEITDSAVNEMESDDDSNSGFNDEELTGNILTNDIDPDGSTGTPSVTEILADTDGDGEVDDVVTAGTQTTIYGPDPENPNSKIVAGTITVNTDGTYTYDPSSEFTGTVDVPYTVCDNDNTRNACSSSTLHLTVLKRNLTVAEDDVNQTPINTKLYGDVSTNDYDKEGDAQQVTAVKGDTDGDGVVDDVIALGTETTVYGDDDQGNRVIAGTIKLNSDGTYEYTPATDFTGEVPLNYTVTDSKGATDPADVLITVIGEDDNQKFPPVATDDHVKTDPDQNVTIPVLSNDNDIDGNLVPSTVTLDETSVPGAVCNTTGANGCTKVTVPNEGTFTVNSNGTVTFDPLPTFTGTTSPLKYEVKDNDDLPTEATITVEITDPLVNEMDSDDDANSGFNDEQLSGNVLNNDVDPDGSSGTPTVSAAMADTDGDGNVDDVLTLQTPTVIYGPDPNNSSQFIEAGVISLNPNGYYSFDPNGEFVGTVDVPYTVCDNDNTRNACSESTLHLTVVERNRTIAEDDVNQTPKNTKLFGDVSTNDRDEEGDDQLVTAILADTDGDGEVDDVVNVGTETTVYGDDENDARVEAGTIKLNSDGTYEFTPATDFTGDVPLNYTMTDDKGATDDADVMINVFGKDSQENYPPVATDDHVKTDPDVNVTIPVLANDNDVDGNLEPSTVVLDPTSVSLGFCVTSNANGCTEVMILGQGTHTVNPDGTVTFDPLPYFRGTTSPLEYKVCDNDGKCDEAFITVEIGDALVNEMNSDDDANSGFNDEQLTGNILTNDIDPDGSTGTPSVSEILADTDGDGDVDDTVTAGTATPIYGPNPSNPTSKIVAGTITVNTDGTYTFDPSSEFTGTVDVPYTVCDNDATRNACSESTLHLTVVERNKTIAEDDVNQTPLNTKLFGDVSTNDRDEEGDAQQVTAILGDTDGDGNVDDVVAVGTETPVYGDDEEGNRVVAGTIKLNSDGTYEYTPETDFKGDVPLNYTVTDAKGATDDADVTIKVLGQDDNQKFPPVATDDHVKTDPDQNVTIPVLSNDNDIDGNLEPSTVTLDETSVTGAVCNTSGANGCTKVTVPNEGTFTVNPDGTVTFDPVPTFTGTTSPLKYEVKDNDDLPTEAKITVEISSPLVNEMDSDDDANSGYNDETLTGNILTNDIDPDGSTGTPSVSEILADTDGDGEVDDTVTAGTATPIYGPDPSDPSSKIVAGSITVNTDGTYTFEPSEEFTGTVDVPYTVCDNDATRNACSESTLHLTVVERNKTIAVDDINQTPINTKLFGDVSTNDRDEEGDDQLVTGILADTDGDGEVDDVVTVGTETTVYGDDENGTRVEAGTIKLNEDGTYEYTPATDYTGELPLNYTVTDDKGATDDADVSIKVVGETSEGFPPIAQDDRVYTKVDQNVSLPILENDSDIDGELVPNTIRLDESSVPGATCNIPLNGCLQVVIPNEGTFTVNTGNGTVLFDPLPTFTGETTPLEYKVCDNDGKCAEANITVVIEDSAVNEMASDDDANSGYNDEQLTGNILTNDIDPDGSTGTPSVSEILADTDGDGQTDDVVTAGTATPIYGPDPANPSSKIVAGSITLNTDGTYTFDPSTAFTGTVDVPYTVCDNDNTRNACSSSTLHLTVIARNATIAVDDINQTPMNTKLFGDVSTNDRDEEGDDQLVTGILADTDGDGEVDDVVTVGTETTVYGDDDSGTRVEAGTIKLNEDGTYEYTPATDYTGELPLNYTVTDDKGATDDADVTITVVGETTEGFPPIAQDDRVYTQVDVNVSLPILENDSDIDGELVPNTIRLDESSVPGATCNIPLNGCLQVVVPNEGTFTVNTGNGTVLFDPLPTFTGETTPLEYKVCDNDGKCAEANITVVIEDAAVNEMASDDDANSGYNDEQLTGNILTNDIDPDGSTGTPSVSEILADTDGDGETDDVVTAGTETPIYGPNPADPATKIVAGSITLNTDGTYTFDPSTAFTGTVDVPYTVCDNDNARNACSSSTLHLTVVARNLTIAEDDFNQTPVNTKLFGDVSTNDRDEEGDDQQVTAILGDTDGDGNVDDVVTVGTETPVYGDDEDGNRVEAGTIKLNDDGTYEYTPATDYTGEVPLNYTVTDTKGATDDADVIIKVVGEDENGLYPPIAQNDRRYTPVDVNVDLPLLENDSDIDGDLVPNTIRLITSSVPGATCNVEVDGCLQVVIPNEGTFTVNAGAQKVTFDPLPTFVGETTPLQYKVCDNDNLCAEAYLTVVIEDPAVNEMKSDDDANSGFNTETLTGNILDNDIDPDGSTGTPSVSEILADTDGDGDVDDTVTAATTTTVYGPDPENPSERIIAGELTLNTDGSYSFVPSTDFVGTIDVPYTVCDNDNARNACSSSTLHLTVIAGEGCLELKVYLQGAMVDLIDAAEYISGDLMRDDIRSKGLLPLTQPYSTLLGYNGTETIADSAAVLADKGENSIVDWVLVEIRSKSDSSNVIQTMAGLLQRDGDIVDVDGVSCIKVDVGSYFISVRHRNHLGVMTAAAKKVKASGLIVDFSSNEPIYDKPGAKENPMFELNGRFMLWGGDVNTNNQVRFKSADNDTEVIGTNVLTNPGNIFNFDSYKFDAYSTSDVNMNGEVRFKSTRNDVNLIQVNVISNSVGNIFNFDGYNAFRVNLPE